MPPALMIDSATTRDRDDALTVTALPDGGWRVSVFIADVASRVPIGSPADQQAMQQGSTIYLPDGRTRPMLGPAEAAASLAPGRDNPVLRLDFTVDPTGTLTYGEPVRDVLTDPVALSYAQADTLLQESDDPVSTMLRAAHDAAQTLLAHRRSRGALAFYDLQRMVETTEEGTLRPIRPAEQHASHIIVQEAMIAYNEGMGRHSAARELILPFRNHAAAAVAVDRSRMLDDLTLLAEHPDQVSLDVIAERFALVLRPAVYERIVSGHWGLRLSAYLHGSSAIRRYADLVVQRVVLADLAGQPSPYTPDEIAEICAHLTALDRERRERRSARHKQARTRLVRAHVSRADFGGFDADAFHKIIKVAVLENRQSPDLLEAITQRLTADRLAPRDLSYLILNTSGHEDWAPLRVLALTWVAAHPEAAVSILAAHSVNQDWPAPSYSESSGGADHLRTFTATATQGTRVAQVSGAVRVARSKKDARQRAAVSLLAALTGLPDPSHDLAPLVSATSEPKTEKLSGNPISAVQEYAQKRGWSVPNYRVRQAGDAHAPSFTVTASLHTDDGDVAGDPHTASSKQQARRKAAASLLAALTVTQPAQPASSSSAVGVETSAGPLNPVGELNEMVQQRLLTAVSYAFERTGSDHVPVFRCAVRAERASGSVDGVGEGTSKATAKTAAATALWHQLQPRN